MLYVTDENCNIFVDIKISKEGNKKGNKKVSKNGNLCKGWNFFSFYIIVFDDLEKIISLVR